MKTWTTTNNISVTRILSRRSNAFLVASNGRYLLIDTGPGSEWEILKRRLAKLNVDHVDYLILTHSHYDHAANAHKVQEFFGAKVIIHRSEESWLRSGKNIVPKGTNPVTKVLVKCFSKAFTKFMEYKPCNPDIIAEDFIDLREHGFNCYIIHTPGHTEGSVSVIADNEIALVGDTMFGVFSGSIYPPFADDTGKMIASWSRLLETGCKIFMPSHGSENMTELVQKEYNARIALLK